MVSTTTDIKREQSMIGKLGTRLVSHDSFGQSFNMKLKDGKTKVQTVSGLVFSIILTLTLIMYAYQKADVLIKKKDSKIFATDLIDAIPTTEVFNTTMGLKIAVAFA